MYSNLYLKSNYSLLSSLISIDKLIAFAVSKKIKTLAICDSELYYVMEFYKKAKKAGIKAIVGLDLVYEEGHILLYAKNYEAYLALSKLATIKEDEKITKEILKQNNQDLIAILPFDSLNYYEELKEVYEELFLGFSDKKEEQKAKNYDQNVVFISETRYLYANDREYLKYLYMIRDGKTITDDFYYERFDKHYLSYEEVLDVSSSRGINNTNLIADLCNLEISKSNDLLPVYDSKYRSEDYLKELAIKGLSLRKKKSKIYQERLLHELEVINEMGFADYFLICYDFIKYAKKEGILVGPGRGSVGGSLVAYATGITDIDPIEYDLLFERFLNKDRITMPDIDTDFPDIYRDQVIDYVREKYGEKKVSSIITFGTLGAKQVIRDLARVLNIKTEYVDRLSKIIKFSNDSIKSYYQESSEFKDIIDSDEKLGLLYKIAKKIENFPRHSSIHAAGIVMSNKDLDEVIPLVKAYDNYLTAYTLEYLEDLGLLKMDFLGIKNLSIIMNILADIKKYEGNDLKFIDIPLEDKKVNELFSRGDTLGIFQFESEGMRNFLRKLKPSSFADIISAIALFRPGPAANIDTFIKRKYKEEKIEYLDKSLEKILESTYGIIVYQEQIMQIASKFSSFTMIEADILRRAMSKKDKEELVLLEDKFIKGAVAKGHDLELAKEVYDLILKFANYGFNKSHSVAYAIVAYKMAYLKANYPKYFFSNLLTSIISNQKKTKDYLDEAKRLKLKVLKPDIVKSSYFYSIEDEGLRFPLAAISGIGAITAKEIAEKDLSNLDLFETFTMLQSRNVSKDIFEKLILAGAFDDFDYNRKTLIENLDKILNYASLAKDLDKSLINKPDIDLKEEYSKYELMSNELKLFGFYLSDHPSISFKEKYRVIDLYNLEKHFNKTVDSIAIVDYIKTIKTKKDEDMSFVRASDNTGSAEYILFPKTHQRFAVEKGDLILVKGRVEKRLDKFQIIVENLKKISY